MNTKLDSKTPATLATAKPGGCVQLEKAPPFSHDVICGLQYGIEQLRDIAQGRWKAKDWDSSDNYVAANIGHAKKAAAYILPHLTESICAMADMWHAHLSAHPSPGGQGDALADEIDLVRAVLDGYPDSMARSDALRAMRVIRAALAARQPVGFMSAEASRIARGMVAHCIEHRLCMGMDEGFASFDPDVEHPFVQELREFAEGARQPLIDGPAVGNG